MFIITPISAAGLIRYFKNHLEEGTYEYYSEGGTETALWEGKLAERLGLVGKDVDATTLAAIVYNIDPRKARPDLEERLKEAQKPPPKLDLKTLKTGQRVRIVREATTAKVLEIDRNRKLAVVKSGRRKRTVKLEDLRSPPRDMVVYPEERLTPRKRERAGYDATASLFKSASILELIMPEIREDHLAAVRETMQELEQEASSRIRKGSGDNSMDGSRTTGETLWSGFTHETARPVLLEDGVIAVGPHIHTHSILHNLTWDAEEGRFKALDAATAVAKVKLFERLYESKVALKLRARGIEIERRGHSYEIAGISRKLIDIASPRTQELKRLAEEKGISNPEALRKLAQTNRLDKKAAEGIEVLDNLKIRAGALFKEVEQVKAQAKKNLKQNRLPNTLSEEKVREMRQEAVEWAIQRNLERSSTVRVDTVLADSLLRAGHVVEYEALKEELAARTDLHIALNPKTRHLELTTDKAVIQERRLLKLHRDGQNAFAPLVVKPRIDKSLSREQAIAATHVLSSKDRMMAVEGQAGTGKSYLLKSLVKELERNGIRPVALAPTAAASRGSLREDGVEDANTVRKFLGRSSTGHALRKKATDGLIIVDEAGMVGTEDAVELAEKAAQLNARVLWVGDTAQLSSVARGHPLELLKAKGDLQSAELSDIYRQQAKEDKIWVQSLRETPAQALEAARKDGRITELALEEGDNVNLVAAEKAARGVREAREAGKSTLTICPTHALGITVSKVVRAELQRAGLVQKDKVEVTVRKAKDQLEADRADPYQLEHGDRAVFIREDEKRGFAEGDELIAIEDRAGKIALHKTTPGGAPGARVKEDINPHNYRLYRKEQISLAVGDTVRALEAIPEAELQRGHIAEIKSISTLWGTLTLSTGEVVPLNSERLGYGYYVTEYGAQGLSRDRVQYVGTSTALPAITGEGLYVGGSRFKEKDGLEIITDDFVGLSEASQRSTIGRHAVDVARVAAAQNKARETTTGEAEKVRESVEEAAIREMRENVEKLGLQKESLEPRQQVLKLKL